MRKRPSKPDLITPEEVMDSPALLGFDTFLQYRPAEDAERGRPQSPMGVSPMGISPIGAFKPHPRIHRAECAEDGHSAGEQALYRALWEAAQPETGQSRLISVGYGGMQSLCRLDKTNCKDNLLSLIRKLAVEVVAEADVRRNQGRVYRVFSPEAVLSRRRGAGMEWVIRNRGVRFTEPPAGE